MVGTLNAIQWQLNQAYFFLFVRDHLLLSIFNLNEQC